MHAWPDGQVPQLMVAPQSLTTKPQVSSSWAHVLPGTMHCMVVVSQMWVGSQAPQLTVAPQPSG